VTELVGNDAFRDVGLGTHGVQVPAELAYQSFASAGTGQQTAVRGQSIEGAEEAEPLDQLAYERVYGDHPFGLQLAERHVNRPLIGAGVVEAIEGKVSHFANAHAGVAE
jgi:hypothetical protein